MDEKMRVELLQNLVKHYVFQMPVLSIMRTKPPTNEQCLEAIKKRDIDYFHGVKIGTGLSGSSVRTDLYDRDTLGPKFAEIVDITLKEYNKK